MERRTVTLRHLVGGLGMLVALTAGATACAPTPSPVYVRQTQAVGTVAPSATPQLSGLDVDPGWHVVLDLGLVQNGSQMTGGSFVSTHAYMIDYACVGNGKFTIAFGPVNDATPTPRESQTVTCAPTPQRGRIVQNDIPASQGVQVVGMADPGVTWHALVEVQD